MIAGCQQVTKDPAGACATAPYSLRRQPIGIPRTLRRVLRVHRNCYEQLWQRHRRLGIESSAASRRSDSWYAYDDLGIEYDTSVDEFIFRLTPGEQNDVYQHTRQYQMAIITLVERATGPSGAANIGGGGDGCADLAKILGTTIAAQPISALLLATFVAPLQPTIGARQRWRSFTATHSVGRHAYHRGTLYRKR